MGVLAEVDRRDDAKGGNHQAHEDRHHECTENCGHQTTLGIGLARFIENELSEPRDKELNAPPGVESVRKPSTDDLGERDNDFTARGIPRDQRRDRTTVHHGLRFGLQGRKALLQSSNLTAKGGNLSRQLQVFRPAQSDAGLIHLAVYVANAVPSDFDELLPDVRGCGDFDLKSILKG